MDFVCRERRLVVEVDGGQHADNEQDRARDYRVLRFWNNDVMRNMDGVLESIAEAVHAESPPHPDRFAARPLPASGER
jgi:very-short-patch-repair endonuclease